MSYISISIKESIEKINSSNQGWFLPAVQRPYVWGSRYESEIYICKLFDSLLRGYPIGGLILWNTEEKIPYREFMRDYKNDELPKIVDKGLWGRRDKWLVYDGQQRLQTLYSCLNYSFNQKIIIFDLLFDMKREDIEQDETGFSFVNKNAVLNSHSVRMNEFFSKYPDEKTKYKLLLKRNSKELQDNEELFETNFDKLWDVFIKKDTKSLAHFPISHRTEKKVNDIFMRLNTGGIELSQSDLLFTKIKEEYYNFEELLQEKSKEIYNITGSGYIFNAYNILQLLNLLIKKTVRVDPKKVKPSEIHLFESTWKDLEKPLMAFFSDFVYGQFKINNPSIISKKYAILPIIVYFYIFYKKGNTFKKIETENLVKIKQFFILSQINDWNTQTIVNRSTNIILDNAEKSNSIFNFPLEDIIQKIEEKNLRKTELAEVNFIDYRWFSLKILTPQRAYQFIPDTKGRFNPEIDHIFPRKLKNQSPEYYSNVDIIWNLQPVKGEVNNFKSDKHPHTFFSNEGNKYLSEYDFIPATDLTNTIWQNPLDFLDKRKNEMINFLKNEYELDLK